LNRLSLATGLLCAAALLAGCAADSPLRTQTSPRTVAVDDDAYLKSLYADPRLDPIRDKVPLLLRPDAIKSNHLSNETRPTPPEKTAITAWLQVREQAQQYQTAQRGPPSPHLMQTRNRVTKAMVQLYGGELTYGEFARRIREIDEEHQSAARQDAGTGN
jgi:hypothetical protein